MNKLIAILLSAVLLCFTAACSSDSSSETETTGSKTAITDDVKANMDSVLSEYGFKEGIVSLTRNGEIIYQYVNGKDKTGSDLTIGSSMYIGSTSKQFCAACIVMLRDQGKLSVDDTLDKYFPEYEAGQKITVKNLLTMRSGIADLVNEGSDLYTTYENSEEENIALIKEWIFSQPLKFEPDTAYAYSNSNYFLLSEIVKQVSGKRYHDYVRENIFEPLGMSHSGFVEEVADDPEWAAGLARGEENGNIIQTGLAQGAGDIASNAADMDKWMAALSDGTIVSAESFSEMTMDHSPDSGIHYGYGLTGMAYDGIGHEGVIDAYNTIDYINTKYGLRLFISSNHDSSTVFLEMLPSELLKNIIE